VANPDCTISYTCVCQLSTAASVADFLEMITRLTNNIVAIGTGWTITTQNQAQRRATVAKTTTAPLFDI
jgi:hypothetical protein